MNNLNYRLVGLVALAEPLILLSLALPSFSQQPIEELKVQEKIEQQVAKESEKIAKTKEKEAEAAAKAAEKAREKAEHGKSPPSPTPRSPVPLPHTVALPDYLTSASILLPSTYYTKRNAYRSPNWYLCPLHGHGAGTKANPFCLDDLPFASLPVPGSQLLLDAMQPGDTLALLPGNYNMDSGQTYKGIPMIYNLVVPKGTASNYSVVTAADPNNPPVLIGGGLRLKTSSFIGSNVDTSYTIYENLVTKQNGAGGTFNPRGNHVVVRNCNIEGNHGLTPTNGDNNYCLEVSGALHCQIYDNVIHDHNPTNTSGTGPQGNNCFGIGCYDTLLLDVFHNNFNNNNGGTYNKDSGGGAYLGNSGWAVNPQYVQSGLTLPAPYGDANAYRANFYQNPLCYEYVGTGEGQSDTLYVRDNVFGYCGVTWNLSYPNAPVNAAQFRWTYRTIFTNNLCFQPMVAGFSGVYLTSSPAQLLALSNSVINNNIIWSQQSHIVPIWAVYLPSSHLPSSEDYNVYLGPTGTTPFTITYMFSGQNLDLQQMKQRGKELHSSVYSVPSQVISNPSTYTLQPRFLTAAANGGAVGPRVPIDYIMNPIWYGPNAPLNPYGLSVSDGN